MTAAGSNRPGRRPSGDAGRTGPVRAVILALSVALGLIAGSGGETSASETWGGHDEILGALPSIAVHIVNDSDVALSLTITNAPCGPRLVLRAGRSGRFEDCLRAGLVYHLRAVFFTDETVLERRDVLFVARLNCNGTFLVLRFPPSRLPGTGGERDHANCGGF